MKGMLINATQQGELRVALVDEQRLYDLGIESPRHEQKRTNIYKGKIARIEPSLEAAFVDYSTERHSSLPLKEIAREYFPANYNSRDYPNIKDVLRGGQEVIVQIDKEEHGNKGTVLTTFISLAGNYLVLMPGNPRAGGVSRRVEDGDRTELKGVLAGLELPDGMGLIVRTAGVGKSAKALQWDLSFRLKHWEAIQKAAGNRPAPFLIHQESNVIVRAFRDYLHQDIGEILIDNPEVMEMARQHIATLGRPGFSSRIKLCTGKISLFNHHQIESQIGSTFQCEVCLPSGGLVVIDSTKALTAVDINPARAIRGGDIEGTALDTNLEAVDEIIHQLRLRDLGGLAVIDFIDMTPVHHQYVVENRLHEAIRRDRARIRVSHISRFSLLEISRQRLSPPLDKFSHHVCPRCSGTGIVRDDKSLSLSILRLIEEEALRRSTREVHAVVPVPVASYLLSGGRTAVNAIETRQNNVRYMIMPDSQVETPHYSVLHVREGEETPTLSYLLPKLRKEAVTLPTEEEYVERKQPEQPTLTTLVIPDVPPAPALQGPTVKVTTPKAAAAAATAAAQPGSIGHFFDALKSTFGGSERMKPVEQPAPKAEEKAKRQQDRRKPRQNNCHDRNDRRDDRDNRGDRDNHSERSENGENCEDNRRNRRQSQQQNAGAHDNHQQTTDIADKVRSGDEQQASRRERNRRRNDDKRQAQQEVKKLNQVEQPVQDTEQEERVRRPQTRHEQHQLAQKVRFIDSPAVEVEVTTVVAIAGTAVAQPTGQPVPAQRTGLAKVDLPTVVATKQEDSSEARDSNGVPCRSRRSPRHLRISGQHRRRYRDERYPVQSPIPLAVACASPELASGKVWIRYPIARPQDQQVEEQREQGMVQQQAAPIAVESQVVAVAVKHTVDAPAPTETVRPEVAVAEPRAAVVETTRVEATHPEVIVTPVEEQPQIIAASDAPVAEEIAAEAEPVADVVTTPIAEEPAEVIIPQPEVVEEIAEVVETAPIVEGVATPKDVVAALVVETEVVKAGVVVTSADAEHLHSHAIAPMTRAPAPEYVPEAPCHNDWQHPAFAFEDKGATGRHSATHQVAVPATHPQPVE